MNVHDVLVVGGGPAGATASIVLARAGFSVAVVEKVAFPRRKVCGEFISATTWPMLHALGLGDRLGPRAGPVVRRVGLHVGEAVVDAPMPAPAKGEAWGRAIGRETLDAALIEAAARAGAAVWQPWALRACEDDGASWHAMLEGPGDEHVVVSARVIVAAHGSWEPGQALATQSPRQPPRDADLLGFKAHFRGARLASGTMPLVLFPGGYGGLVATDDGRTSFSCCVRRDALQDMRASLGGHSTAGEAVLALAMAACRGLREALEGAGREGPWLGAGPMRPGLRTLARRRLFAVGNAAGEAHPLVAEGLSMAMQSGWILANRLAGAAGLGDAALAAAGVEYSRAWRKQFAARVRASQLFATLALEPQLQRAAVALFPRLPALLTWGARRSGKARILPSLEAMP